MSDVRSAVITVVHGRHDHLRHQQAGLQRSEVLPDDRWVVAIADRGVSALVTDGNTIEYDCAPDVLPLARARNLGASCALDSGADVLIFLDVDCIPGPSMVGRYLDAHRRTAGSALFSGPVTYLPSSTDGYRLDDLDSMTAPHPARPDPRPGTLVPETNYDLFWSLSFAVSAATWRRLGGFCEEYIGYGGEDTDFGAVAATERVPLVWVGGAHAYHQYHPVSDPPVEHLAAIVENSRVFRRRWGRWPMAGWLDEFERAGAIVRDGEHISVTDRRGYADA